MAGWLQLLMMTHASGCSDPAWNLVRPRSWWSNIHFETKKQSQKREDWFFVNFNVRWNWIILLSADCPGNKTFVTALRIDYPIYLGAVLRSERRGCWTGMLLQPLRWCCVECVIHHERDVREEQHHRYMWREQAIIEWSWRVISGDTNDNDINDWT